MTYDRTALSIRAKLLLLVLIVGVLPIALMGVGSYWRSRSTLEEQAERHLITIREFKKQQVEAYFRNIRRQIETLAEDPMVVAALKEFTRAWSLVEDEYGPAYSRDREGHLQKLMERYRYQRQHTPGTLPDADAAWFPATHKARILQSLYIAENPAPIGHKQELDHSPDGTTYSQLHHRYHPILRHYLQSFGYYDLFLVEPREGTIVYSVAKELDFATGLLAGPYRHTNLARIFRRAWTEAPRGASVLTDFERYEPSYNLPAAFIAAPVWDGDRKAGALILQLSIDQINSIMTDGQQWEKVGLGKTGESYLVGSDYLLRTDLRRLIENKEAYLTALDARGVPRDIIDRIRATGTSILTVERRTNGGEAALAGHSGFGVYLGGRKYPELSAYAPLTIEGLHWAIVAKIDQVEAYEAVHNLTSALLLGVLVVTVLALGAGLVLMRSVMRPIRRVADELHELAAGDADLTRRIPVQTADELGQLARNFNHLMDNLLALVKQVQRSGIQVTTSATGIAASARQLEATATQQAASTHQVVATAQEISATSRDLVATMDEVAVLSENTSRDAASGQQDLGHIQEAMSLMEKASQSISARLSTINEKSANITSIITTISKVADQTNLLSLNAAIEAEKAGEYGLGFGVVAREIRRLADQTAVATLDIEQMVKEMQGAVTAGVMEMDKFAEEVRRSVAQVGRISGQLQGIVERVQVLSPRFEAVSVGMQSQAEGAGQISLAMVQVSEGAGQTAEALREFNQATLQLKDAATTLQHEVARFQASSDGARPLQ